MERSDLEYELAVRILRNICNHAYDQYEESGHKDSENVMDVYDIVSEARIYLNKTHGRVE